MLTLQSGQIFRWRELAEGFYEVLDGPHRMILQHDRGVLKGSVSSSPSEVRRLFQLEQPWSHLREQLAERCPALEPLLDRVPGLRLLRFSDPAEVLLAFICSQNNHIARIRGMVNHVASLGVGGFPGLERIAELPESYWRAKGFGYRGRYIPAVTRILLARGGQSYLLDLRRAPYAEAAAELRSLPGVGPKVADCVALFGLHHGEAAPIDVHVWRAYTLCLRPEWKGISLTSRKCVEAGADLRDRFGPLAGWAQQVLFTATMLGSKGSIATS